MNKPCQDFVLIHEIAFNVNKFIITIFQRIGKVNILIFPHERQHQYIHTFVHVGYRILEVYERGKFFNAIFLSYVLIIDLDKLNSVFVSIVVDVF